MGRKCKCAVCGKDLNTDTAYAVKDGSRNKYFCEEQEYKDLTKLEEAIEYIMGYRSKNNIINRYIKEWVVEPHCAEVIDDNKEEVYDILSRKRFDTEYGMIQYLQAVINNNLHDWTELYEMHLESERTKGKCSDADLYECKCCPPRKMKCLDDFDI